jgi:hypothetical protein
LNTSNCSIASTDCMVTSAAVQGTPACLLTGMRCTVDVTTTNAIALPQQPLLGTPARLLAGMHCTVDVTTLQQCQS